MKENGHWYTPEGQPCHFVARATGQGTRPTTIADARKLGLIPSVTTILKCLDKPALRDWLVRQAVYAVVTDPGRPDEGLDAKITRVLEQECQQDQEAAIARDRGTEIHEAMAHALEAGSPPETVSDWIRPAIELHGQLGTPQALEFVVVGRGYAGRCDVLFSCGLTGHLLLDFKTTGKLPTKGSWPEHRLQTAAYAEAHYRQYGIPVRTGNLYISTKEPGKIAYFEQSMEEWQDTFERGFKPLLKFWQYWNQYP